MLKELPPKPGEENPEAIEYRLAPGAAAHRDALKILDISQETNCHVMVAQGTKEAYQAHPTTTTRADNKTIIAVWNVATAVMQVMIETERSSAKRLTRSRRTGLIGGQANAMGRTLFAQHL